MKISIPLQAISDIDLRNKVHFTPHMDYLDCDLCLAFSFIAVISLLKVCKVALIMFTGFHSCGFPLKNSCLKPVWNKLTVGLKNWGFLGQ